jgi:hypothetical protein
MSIATCEHKPLRVSALSVALLAVAFAAPLLAQSDGVCDTTAVCADGTPCNPLSFCDSCTVTYDPNDLDCLCLITPDDPSCLPNPIGGPLCGVTDPTCFCVYHPIECGLLGELKTC